jgi:osmotically-inducible protein OsmY
MLPPLRAAAAALFTAGCMSPAALTRGAKGISGKVTPAARAFANGTRRVVRYAGQAADDAALAARVKAALAMRKGLDGSSIQVVSEEGVVRLSGHVRNASQKHLAAEAARNTTGVAGVTNGLKVNRPS